MNVKRLLQGVAAALAVALLPQPSQAQVLKAFCDSEAVNWCFNATAFDYVQSASTSSAGDSRFDWSLTGHWSGDAFVGHTNLSWGFFVQAPGWHVSGYSSQAFTPGTTTTGLNTYTDGVESDYLPTLDNLALDLNWRGDDPSGAFVGGSCQVANGTCYSPEVSVPEPETGLLMLTGLLGLGLIARRREDSLVV